jgi:hypothetical protein
MLSHRKSEGTEMQRMRMLLALGGLAVAAALLWSVSGCSDQADADADADVDGDSDTDVDGDGDGDSDGDGLDSDGDGRPDAVEDSDGDGEVDPGESDPHDSDTDNDGVLDGDEHGDSDGDGTPDVLESNTFDGDGDGTADSGDSDDTDGPCANPPRLLDWVTISTDTVLSLACSPYVVEGPLTVIAGATLTIEPGVEVRFRRRAWLMVGDGYDLGRLVARGTAAARIVLHSDEPASAAGDWGGVVADDTDQLELHFVDVSHAGMAGVHGDDHRGSLVVLSGDGLQLEDTTITAGQAWAVHAVPPSSTWEPIFTSFVRNRLTGSERSIAVLIDGLGEIGEGNVVDHPIDVHGTLVSRDALWQDVGAPLRMVDTALQVDAGVALQIAAGVEVIVPDDALLTVDGTLRAVGSDTAHVSFSSESGAAGTWQGLYFSDTGSELRYTDITGGGAPSWYLSSPGAALILRELPVTTERIAVVNSSGYGVYLETDECTGMPVDATFTSVASCAVYCYDAWGETACLSE